MPVSISSPALGRVGPSGPLVSRSTLRLIGLVLLAVGLAIAASHVSRVAFYLAAALLLVVLAYLSYRSPRVMLIAVVFLPFGDRYLVSLLVEPSVQNLTDYVSEALLLLVSAVIVVRGIREGTLSPELRHPVVGMLAIFVLIGIISAAVNGVPPLIAAAGILFTVDACALFVLPRVIGFTPRHAAITAAAFTVMATAAGLLALGQVILRPDFLGMETITGRFSEGARVAAWLLNPNMLGALLAMTIPFTLISAVRADRRWLRRVALAMTFIMALALLYTFSRGAWLGMATAILVVGFTVDRRALVLAVAMAAVVLGAAFVIPRHVLIPGGDGNFDLGGATVGRLDNLDGGAELRVLFVDNALPIIADHPLVGAGPGRYGGSVARLFDSPLYDRYTTGRVPRGRTVDNFWLHLIVEFGLLGAAVLVATISIAVRQLIVAARRSAGLPRGLMAAFAAVAIVLAVDSLTEMLLEGNTTSFANWFFLGVGTALAGGVVGKAGPAEARADQLRA